MKDFEKDPNYWIQFDQDIKDLPVDNILLDNEEDTIRIKELFWNALDIELNKAGISFDWYDVYQFLENGTNLSLNTLETNNLEEIKTIVHDSDNINNLCIIECKGCFLPSNEDMERMGNLYKDFRVIYATTINNDIQKKYRINFLYKD